MKNSKENLNSQSAGEFGELQSRLDAEFEEHERIQLEGSRREIKKIIRMTSMKHEEAELMIAKKEKEFSEMDSYQRVTELVNNFHLWFPGGLYRQLLSVRKLKPDLDLDKDKIARDEKLVADLDVVIRECGYESVAENIAKRVSLGREQRLKILAEVYLKMRDRGYERVDLTC